MKRSVLILLFILMMMSAAVAGEPTFAGITWEDGDEAIIAKIGKIQGFSAIPRLRKQSSISFEICNMDKDGETAIDIKPTALTNSGKKPDGHIDTKMLKSNDAEDQITSIDFSRSKITDKLLAINVAFNKDRDSFSRDLGDRIDLLLKKHGLPSRIIRDTYQWKISNVEIDADGSSGIVSYHHLINIEEHCKLQSQKSMQ